MIKETLKSYSVLYIEDESGVRSSVVEFLERYFHTVYSATNGMEGLSLYQQHKPQVLLSDIEMPGLDGLRLVEKIRQSDKKILILLLTAYTDTDRLLKATELHLVKYLVKPVMPEQFREALGLVAKELKRQQEGSIDLQEGFWWEQESQTLYHHQNRVDLSVKEQNLLDLLIHHHHTCVSFETIMAYVWPNSFDTDISIDSVKSQISLLRKKLPTQSIKSVYGVGYILQ